MILHVYVYICLYVRMHMYMHIDTCIQICMYVYIYVHVSTRSLIWDCGEPRCVCAPAAPPARYEGPGG